MAATDIVLLWFSLSTLSQCCVALQNPRIRQHRLSYDDFRQRCLARNHGSLSQLLLALPPFQDIIRSLRAPWRFWTAPREQGFWEKDVCMLWRNMGKCTLTGNGTVTCSISECQRIHSGTSVKPMASILRRQLLNCADHLFQQRGWPLFCTG